MSEIKERAIKIEDEIINLNPQPIYWKAIRMAAIKGATEQKAIDIELIPQIYVRWLMIDGEKPSWNEYATKAMEE